MNKRMHTVWKDKITFPTSSTTGWHLDKLQIDINLALRLDKKGREGKSKSFMRIFDPPNLFNTSQKNRKKTKKLLKIYSKVALRVYCNNS